MPDTYFDQELADSLTSIVPLYEGMACNNLLAPSQTVANNSINTKVARTARCKLSGAGRVRLPWFFLSNAGWEVSTGLGAATVSYAIEYPAGTFTTATFPSGGSVAAGGVIWGTFTWPEIPEGATFWEHAYATTAGSNIPLRNRGSNTGAKNGGSTFSNGQADRTTDPTFVPSSPHIYWGADALTCQTNRRTFMVMGDSREEDLSGQFDQSNDGGVIGRALGPHFGISASAIAGGSVGGSTTGSRVNTLALAAYVTDFIVALGYNDRGDVALLETRLATLYSDIKTVNPAVKIGQTTIYSGLVTTPDSFALANTGLSSSTTTATVTGLSQKAIDQLWVGETIRVAGVTPSGYNGTVVITAIDPVAKTYSYTLLAGASGLAASTVHGTTSDRGQSPNPTVFQTPAVNAGNLAALNQGIRRGNRTQQDYFIELANVFDYGPDLLFIKPNVTTDGVHPNNFGMMLAEPAVVASIPGLLAA